MVARRRSTENVLASVLFGLTIHCGGIASQESSPEPPRVVTGGASASGGSASATPDGPDTGANAGKSVQDEPDSSTAMSSCKALRVREPAAPSDFYFVTGGGAEEHFTYCDMDTDGGGWTRVSYPQDSDDWIAGLIGGRARQMLKCESEGREHVISPSFSEWSWSNPGTNLAPGQWVVNGHAIGCGANRRLAPQGCSIAFGVGCSDGPAQANNFLPGVSATAEDACADRSTVYTTGVFSVCGDVAGDPYTGWVTFLREEDEP